MSKSINLLPNKNKRRNENDTVLIVIRRLSLFSLISVLFFSLMLLALTYDTRLPALRRQENADLTNLSLLHSKTAKILFIRERLQNISTILNDRSSYESLLSQINTMLPGNVSVQSITATKKSITLVISSPSLSSISNLLDTMTDMVNSKQTFKEISITDLVADADTRQYSVSVKADLL